MRVPMSSTAARSAALGCFLLFATPSLAADPQKIANDLVNAIQSGGRGQAAYEAAVATGNDVSISGFRIAGAEDGGAVEITTVIITNPLDRAEGGFTAERILFGSGSITSTDAAVSWATATMTGATVPSPAELEDTPRFQPFATFAVEGLTIRSPDLADPLEVGRFDVTLGGVVDGMPYEVALNVGDINVSPEALGDMLALATDGVAGPQTVQDLGITEGLISFGFDAGYKPDEDKLDLRSVSLAIAKIGALDISATLSEVPLSLLQTREGMEKLATSAKIDSARIRFENAGIVEWLLDRQAAETGLTREQLTAQFTAAMPFMLSLLGDPALQQRLSAAAANFLLDPRAFTITANPATPISLVEMATAASAAPLAVLGLLAVDATAND